MPSRPQQYPPTALGAQLTGPTAGTELLEGYLRPHDLARQLGVSIRTLDRWHAQRIGPPRCMIGRLILYRVTAVRDWMMSREIRPVHSGQIPRSRGHQ
jgi:hypothetical protein